MNKLPLAALLCVTSATLSAQTLRIVNAASLSEVKVAPGTIVSIFGARLATAVAAADDARRPPASLGGVSVTIGGKAAALFYVSPTQINAVVDPGTPAGIDPVVVTSPAGTQNGTLAVAADAPPGLFSLTGTGSRDGAILNAITFLLGDFSTRTANSPTYLALFATGLTTSTPVVTVGGVPVEVAFAGPAPCCAGLEQINIVLPDSLAGAGRVPVVVTSNGHASNTVEVVLLPPASAKQFSDDQDNQKRSRELAALAYVPNTSFVLSTDQNDDVMRVIDVSTKTVTKVVALPDGASPVGVAVNAAGTLAVVAESGTGRVAIVDLKTFTVTKEIPTGPGASSVAIAGSRAIVVNRDNDTATVVDLVAGAVIKTLDVGRGPMSVAADPSSSRAAVTNENDGSISVIDLAAATILKTVPLGASIRPEGIAFIPASGVVFVTVPGNGPEGLVMLVNLASGETTSTQANPDRSGGSTDVVYFNGKLYLANQAGGSVSVLPVSATGTPTGPIATIPVDLGARAMAVDVNDNLLVVSNEGSGTLVLVSLASNTVVGRVAAVRSAEDDDKDDRTDRDRASNLPTILSVSPQSSKAGVTLTITVKGINLTGATEMTIGSNPGNGNGNGSGSSNGKGQDKNDFTVKNLAVSSDGTQLTASVTIDAAAKPGARFVQIKTPNGESAAKGPAVFMVLP